MRAQLRTLLRRFSGRGRPVADRDLDEEMVFHVQMEADKYIRDGMSEAEAYRRARLNFGAYERVKEECRDERKGSQIDMLMQDLRYGLRTLLKNPGFRDRGDFDARARHRRQHGDLQRDQRRSVTAAAVRQR